jgi:anti-sigma regulatory factor (Ser/Thr protein kinase)
MSMTASHREWSARALPESIRRLRDEVTGFAAEAGISGTALDDIRACVSEAVTNAIVHAFPDGRAPGTVRLVAELRADELVIRVIDDGIGFRPRSDSPGLGLGIPTITTLTASMSLAASRHGGTELCMAFTLPEALHAG